MTDEEINSQIATKVMGWELLEVRQFGMEEETPRQRELEDWMDHVGIWEEGDYWIDVAKDDWIKVRNWEPDRYIDHAFQAVGKVITQTHYFQLYCDEVSIDGAPGIWHCTFLPFHPNRMVWEATAPLAICKACLEAVSVREIAYGKK